MTDKTLTQQVLSMFSKASSIFESKFSNNPLVRSFLDDYTGFFKSCYEGDSVSSYSDGDAHCHKSLGCFFDMATGQLSKFLKSLSTGATGFNAEESFSMYALLVDMLWQRMLDVYAVFGVNDRPSNQHSLLDAYSDGFFSRMNARSLTEGNEPLYRMSRWAHFLRHPKELGWLLHQPRFLFVGSEELEKILAEETRFRLRIIDDEFIRKHYPTDLNDGRAYESYEFERKKVVIVLPDIAIITEEICSCLISFVEIVAPVYCKMLNNTKTKMQARTIE